MNIIQRLESDITIIQLEGRLDWNGLPEFSSVIAQNAEAGYTKILLDFSKTEYMSSAGIRALIEAMQRLESKGGKLAICSPSESLQELFEVVQLNKIIKIHPNEFTALDNMMS